MNEHTKRMCLGLEGEGLDQAISTALNKTEDELREFAGQIRHNLAVTYGRKGGKVRSPAKTRAARLNGRKGGRPRKQPNK